MVKKAYHMAKKAYNMVMLYVPIYHMMHTKSYSICYATNHGINIYTFLLILFIAQYMTITFM